MGMFLPCVPGFLLLFLCSVPLGRTWLRSAGLQPRACRHSVQA